MRPCCPHQGELVEARENLGQALTPARTVGLANKLAGALRGLGDAARLAETPATRVRYKGALGACAANWFGRGESVRILIGLGRSAATEGRLDEARDWARQAADLAVESPGVQGTHRVRGGVVGPRRLPSAPQSCCGAPVGLRGDREGGHRHRTPRVPRLTGWAAAAQGICPKSSQPPLLVQGAPSTVTWGSAEGLRTSPITFQRAGSFTVRREGRHDRVVLPAGQHPLDGVDTDGLADVVHLGGDVDRAERMSIRTLLASAMWPRSAISPSLTSHIAVAPSPAAAGPAWYGGSGRRWASTKARGERKPAGEHRVPGRGPAQPARHGDHVTGLGAAPVTGS